MEMDKKSFPEGWKEITVGDACDKISLNGIKIKQKDYLPEGKFPVVDQGQDLIGGYYNDESLLVPGSPPYVVFGDHTRVKKFVSFNFIAGADGVKVLKPKAVFEPKLFYYFINAIKIPDKGYARHFQHLEKATIPLPPLPEQEQIVAKIEELFSELDAGKQEAEKAAQQLKIYRQAVLKWAFEGRLTNEDVVDGELPQGWKITKLRELGTWKGGGTPSKSRKDFWEGGTILWVSPKDMKSMHISDTIDRITPAAVEGSSTNLIPKGSVLFVVRSGILRRTLPIALTTSESTVNQDLQAFTPKEILPEYVYYFAAAANDAIRSTCSKDGTTVESIDTASLKDYEIPVCSPEEQHRIVQEIEARLSVCDELEKTLVQSLQQAEALRQSILKKAFEGKLVAKKYAKIVPFLPILEEDGHLRKVFAGYIISRCYNDRYFGRVVFQKILHLAEYHCQLDYQTCYLKQAAGPMDKFIYRLIKEADEKDWFTVHERGKQFRFEPGPGLAGLLYDYPVHFASHNGKLEQVLRLMKGRNMDEAELFSTVYAVWNNCIIQSVTPDKQRMVREVHAWSDRKERFNESQIWHAKGVLERTGLSPVGWGLLIEK